MIKYKEVAQAFADEINNNAYLPNQRIPSENELAEQYNVSRVTIRKAIDALIENGYLVRIHNRGTYVNENIVEKKLSGVVSFSKSAILRGETPSTKVLEFEKTKADDFLQETLKISGDEELFHIKRVRYTDTYPLVYEESYWRKAIAKGLNKEIAGNSVFSYLKRIGAKPCHGQQEIEALLATEELAELLNTKPNLPILRSTIIFYTKNYQSIGVAINHYRADRFKLSLLRDLNE